MILPPILKKLHISTPDMLLQVHLAFIEHFLSLLSSVAQSSVVQKFLRLAAE